MDDTWSGSRPRIPVPTWSRTPDPSDPYEDGGYP